MKKIYHLSTCDTNQRIIRDLDLEAEGFEFQDIKTERITPDQLDEMKERTGSYEALFSKRAMKYKSMGLNERVLSEQDVRDLILGEYTFLKRPVIFVGDQIFVGNSKKVIEAAGEAIHSIRA